MIMRHSITTKLIFALLLSLVLQACATSPTGRSQLMLVSEDSAIAQSKQAYVQTVGQMQSEGKLSDDRELVRRVDIITRKLVAQAIIKRPDSADWEWSVAVIDDPDTVNAWCMAGGRMAIYSGLIEQLNASDAEIAQVMGHEISHALANHTAEKMSMAMASSVGAIAVGVLTDSGAAAAGAGAAATVAINLPNSRTAETEADQIGIELAAKAGYDPAAAVTLWQKMGELSESRPPQFLSTHPDPENRQQRLAELGAQMEPYYRAADNNDQHPVTVLSALH